MFAPKRLSLVPRTHECGRLPTSTVLAMSVLLETSLGDLVVDLWVDEVAKLCTNFLKLCSLKYYNDCSFFRVEKGFIAMAGDPENTGEGGESAISFVGGSDHVNRFLVEAPSPKLSHAKRGVVSMVGQGNTSSGQVCVGSQFFITLDANLEYLDSKHLVFGRVAEGWETLEKLEQAMVDDDHCPFRLIRIRHTIILDDPFPDLPGMAATTNSPPPRQGGEGDRLGSDEEESELGGEAGRAAREAREARSRAEVLEMLGDIGDADMKPPDNVLFVCKLNPVTEADDLEIIFSRFGDCKVDVMRDRETGASLCYGFVEYSRREACEKAFFRLNNALVDDRRVRVDFSQSVSKLWNARRRGMRPKLEEFYP